MGTTTEQETSTIAVSKEDCNACKKGFGELLRPAGLYIIRWHFQSVAQLTRLKTLDVLMLRV
jgi:hypothetical protein